MGTNTYSRLIDDTRSTTWVDPRRHGSRPGPLPSGWEELKVGFTSSIVGLFFNTCPGTNTNGY